MENQDQENLEIILQNVIKESTTMALKYEQVSRAYVNCQTEIKEIKNMVNKQLGFFADRIEKLEKAAGSD